MRIFLHLIKNRRKFTFIFLLLPSFCEQIHNYYLSLLLFNLKPGLAACLHNKYPVFCYLCIQICTDKMAELVDIHTYHTNDAAGIALRSLRVGYAKIIPAKPFSAGIHPWDIDTIDNIDTALDYIKTADIEAVGECGADYLKNAGNKPAQLEVFRQQVEIASSRRLPVIVHCVRAFEDIMSILGYFPGIIAIFHGYIGSPQQTARLINGGHYISAGLLSIRSPKTVQSLKAAPLERIFLETDDNDITIDNIYSEASQAIGVPLPELKNAMYNNYIKLFDR